MSADAAAPKQLCMFLTVRCCCRYCVVSLSEAAHSNDNVVLIRGLIVLKKAAVAAVVVTTFAL